MNAYNGDAATNLEYVGDQSHAVESDDYDYISARRGGQGVFSKIIRKSEFVLTSGNRAANSEENINEE